MKSNHLSKIHKLGKAGYILCRICRVFLMIGLVACLVGALLLCFVPEDAMRLELTTDSTATLWLDEDLGLLQSLAFGSMTGFLEINAQRYAIQINGTEGPLAVTQTVNLSLADLKWPCFAGALACVLGYLILFFAGTLCATLRDCESPFTEQTSKGLIRLAWSLLPMALLPSLNESLSSSFLSEGWSLYLNLDLTAVLLILCFFLLAYIFKYGTELQTESDETL